MTNTTKNKIKKLGLGLLLLTVLIAGLKVNFAYAKYKRDIAEYGKENYELCLETKERLRNDAEFDDKVSEFMEYVHRPERVEKSYEELVAEGAEEAYQIAVETCRLVSSMY